MKPEVLLRLVDDAIAVSGRLDAAYAVVERLQKEFRARRPEKPDLLKWGPFRSLPWLGYVRGEGNTLWCNPEDIERFRTEPVIREAFIGTQEDWERIPSAGPVPEDMKHLWAPVPDPKGQQYVDTVIAADDQYQAEVGSLRSEIGLDVAEGHAEQLAEQLDHLKERIFRSRATTVEGLKAKARFVFEWYWNREIATDFRGLDGDEAIMVSITRDLLSGVKEAA